MNGHHLQFCYNFEGRRAIMETTCTREGGLHEEVPARPAVCCPGGQPAGAVCSCGGHWLHRCARRQFSGRRDPTGRGLRPHERLRRRHLRLRRLHDPGPVRHGPGTDDGLVRRGRSRSHVDDPGGYGGAVRPVGDVSLRYRTGGPAGCGGHRRALPAQRPHHPGRDVGDAGPGSGTEGCGGTGPASVGQPRSPLRM